MPSEVWDWFWSLLIMGVVLGFFGVWHFVVAAIAAVVSASRTRTNDELREARRTIKKQEKRIEELMNDAMEARAMLFSERARNNLSVEGKPGSVPDWGTPS